MPKAYKAKWIIPADGKVYEDHILTVEEGKVVAIIPEKNFKEDEYRHVKDYGNSVITPGFISLHNHLQYTDIGKPCPKSFKKSCKKLISNFRKTIDLAGVPKESFSYKVSSLLNEYFCWERKDKLNSFRHGMELSVLSGTTCLCQLSKETKYFEILNKSPVKTYLFFELFSDSQERSKQEFYSIQKRIEKLMLNKSENTFIGLAPHSVYSVHKRLWKILTKYCNKNNILMTLRLAQSQEELDWLKHGFSDVDLINKFSGLNKFEPFEKGLDPVEYLKNLDVLNKKVIVSHVNFLNEEQLEKLSQTGVNIAYIPRSSDKIHKQKTDFSTLLKHFPKRIGFGTNHLPFNEDLSVLKEAAYVNNNTLEIPELINYLTLYPAKILRIDNITGSLTVGRDADFNIFKLSEGENYTSLLKKDAPDYVYIKAHRVVSDKKIKNKAQFQ